MRVRDLPLGGRPLVLVWSKGVWRCEDPDCSTRTWTETNPAIGARVSLSERARRDACRRVGRDGHSVAQVARDLGVGWSTVMAAVRDYGQPLVDDPDRRRLMGRIRTAITAPIPVDVLVAEVREFEAGRDVKGSPYYWPTRDGRIVYDRSAA